MKIATWISGIISLVLLIAFLGKYAVSINSVPLWVIIIGGLAMPIADFVVTLRAGGDGEEDAGRPE